MSTRSDRQRVLVVEDDRRLAALVSSFLEDAGYSATTETRGDRVAARVAEVEPDAILLDIALPGKSGFEVCREIRGHYDGTIIMLTAKTEEIDEVLGLELGADDYLAKPVRPRALLARLERFLRPPRQSKAPKPFGVGPLWIAPARREVTSSGRRVDLTSLEFDVLLFLAQEAGQIVSRERLYSDLRGFEWDGADRWADLAISRLRRKLGDNSLIKTVRNRGYLLVSGPR